MKNVRQREILKIIQEQDIDTQEQLLEALRVRGFSTTQATISRDIKDLRLVKELTGNGGYRYTLSERKTSSTSNTRLRNIFKECVTEISYAQNMVVIKTLPGLGQAAAMAIDAMRVREVVGTLGGDDTVFVVMRDTESAERFCSEAHFMLN